MGSTPAPGTIHRRDPLAGSRGSATVVIDRPCPQVDRRAGYLDCRALLMDEARFLIRDVRQGVSLVSSKR